jgi:NAD(P)-dependent dehydrogenase (short-subunit alcohol dehydrogenase family)
VVTGADGGLSLVTAQELAPAGAHVLLAALDQDKAGSAEGQIPQASTEIVPVDVGWLASVRKAADETSAPTSASTC